MGNRIKVWISKVNQDDSGMEKGIERQKDIVFEEKAAGSHRGLQILVDEKTTYQKMDGFGISITEASAYLCQNVLDKQTRKEMLEAVFDVEKGIGVSMIRQTIGASDHCTSPYGFAPEEQADDLPLYDFSSEEDRIIPTVREAYDIADGDLKILAAPWSPPAWMKENNAEVGVNAETGVPGFLRRDKYQAYANYLVKFIRHYEDMGFPIYIISLANESDNACISWPALPFKPKEAAEFAAKYLAPALKKNGLATKILCWDDSYANFNYVGDEYVKEFFSNKEAYEVTAGTGWHWYVGDVSTLARVKRMYPDKEIWFTEGSGGDWGYKQWREAFLYQSNSIIDICRNWSQSIVYWNMALDENGTPDYYYMASEHKHSKNRGIITIDRKTGEWNATTDYYTLGHFSKFVRPGALRIESTSYTGKSLRTIAFINTNGSKVLTMLNTAKEEKEVVIRWGSKEAAYKIPAVSLATFLWEGIQDGVTVSPIIFNTFEKGKYYLEGRNMIISEVKSTSNLKSEKCLKLFNTGDGIVGDLLNGCVRAFSENGEMSVDITGYSFLTFFFKDTKRYNGVPVRVALADTHGNIWTGLTEEKSVYCTWTQIHMSLENVTDVDMTCIREVRIGVDDPSRGLYYVDSIEFCLGYFEELVYGEK